MLITDCNIVPLDEEVSRRSLGFYTETETQRLYYYFSVGAYEEKWKIYRFAVDKEPLEWEFVGDLDIKIKNVCVSPCGRYFWSIQITRDNYARFPKSLFFRQVDIRTLDYIEFETPALTYEDGSPVGIRSLRFQHTTHNTFLFFHVCYSKDRISKFIDEVYLLDVDPVKRQVHFKHIDLPNLLTGDLFPVSWFTHPDHHSAKWCVGLVEHQHSVYFYRIDYFGDLYVLNYQSTGPLNWTKFSITGNYRPAAWITYSIRDIDAAAEAANEYWVLSTNRLDNSKRFFLEDGIVFEYTYDDGPIVFYQLEFQFENAQKYFGLNVFSGTINNYLRSLTNTMVHEPLCCIIFMTAAGLNR
ncbi:hypothetical protein M3Y95_00398100 [Aphelenchoides besseyi]|nr:hypothetical protein M3Y95_00398100 [Aphelenchoides besseyi]